ncbi:putative ribosomal protein L29, partial [Leifsonia aquatica ATCC 14665]
MAIDESNFTQVFRGYDKDEVDKAVQELRRELIKSNTQASDSTKEIKRLQLRIDELSAEIEEVGSPTYSGLGTKLENTLRVAEEQSTRLIAQADIDAEKLRAGVADEIEKVKKAAAQQAERLIADATARATTALEDAQIEATELQAKTRADKETLLNDAMREAAGIRGAVATEAAELRATSKREA